MIVEAQREHPEVLEAPGQGPKRVWKGAEEDFIFSPSLRNLMTRSCFPTELPSMWLWYGEIVAACTLRLEGDSSL